jgi:glycerol-3-phosphate acyltransferase PlsY
MDARFLAVIAAYLIGSLPTAVLVSRVWTGRDIRTMGDGNMGARNTARALGWKLGAVVGFVDVAKGALSVALAARIGAPPAWQYAAGAAAVLGHDFPIWAGFRGGQGMATALGAMAASLPTPTLTGLSLLAACYLLSRNFDRAAALGLGSIVVLAWMLEAPTLAVIYGAGMFVSIGLKKAWDLPRRREIARHAGPR